MPIAGLLAGWLGAFILVKGFNENADIQANTFWRLLMPAWPAYLLLFAAIPLLVPTLFRRLGTARRTAGRPPRACALGGARARAHTCCCLPPRQLPPSRIAPPTPAIVPWTPSGEILTPVDTSIGLTAETAGDTAAALVERRAVARGRLLSRLPKHACPTATCRARPRTSVTWVCYFFGEPLGDDSGRDRSSSPIHGPGATYRIGVGTNWANNRVSATSSCSDPPIRGGAVTSRRGGLAGLSRLRYSSPQRRRSCLTRALGARTNFDEGVYLASLDAMRRGQELGSEIYTSQPPVFYWLLPRARSGRRDVGRGHPPGHSR